MKTLALHASTMAKKSVRGSTAKSAEPVTGVSAAALEAFAAIHGSPRFNINTAQQAFACLKRKK